MRRIIYFIFILLLPNFSEAHSPLISTVALIKSKENIWTVHISASLSAFQYALTSDDKSLQLDSLSSDLFQQKIIDLLRRKLKIEISGVKDTKLENGIVKLGHETEVVFKLSGNEKNTGSIKIENGSFLSIPDHYCILKVITPEGASSNILLEKRNNYFVALSNKNSIYTQSDILSFNWKFILFWVALFIFIFYSNYFLR